MLLSANHDAVLECPELLLFDHSRGQPWNERIDGSNSDRRKRYVVLHQHGISILDHRPPRATVPDVDRTYSSMRILYHGGYCGRYARNCASASMTIIHHAILMEKANNV